jgi:[citrate (pro-3S)-lyase] ligase
MLATSGRVTLLEHGPGLEAWLWEHAALRDDATLPELAARPPAHLREPARHGAVVINGNPFTLGHLHLVEMAAARSDQLFLFIVREDRSVFPYSVRRTLAERATAHLRNLRILDTSRYAISAGTFPSYFLRRLDERASEQMAIDLDLFGRRLAPAFGIATRFAGEEPFCPTTAAYNRAMAELLPSYGVGLVLIPRLRAVGADGRKEGISATQVRDAFLRGDYDAIRRLVPPATMEFLRSSPADEIRRKLAAQRPLAMPH